MGSFVVRDIVVCEFPFSDLSAKKKRPALVISGPFGSDYLLCAIMSKKGLYSIEIKDTDFETGGLRKPVSYLYLDKLFTAENVIILYSAGKITVDLMDRVRQALRYTHKL